jgi:hypothetical protein
LADVSNLNIIPKSTVDWFVKTITGIKAKVSGVAESSNESSGDPSSSHKNVGLMGNVGYLIIILIGVGIAIITIFLVAAISKRFPK